MELCQIILDTCAKQQVYILFYGSLGEHFCSLKKTKYIACFEKIFQDQYEFVFRLDNVKLGIVAKFFAHLLLTDAIS
jgi:pre-mRNA-splicing factor CWC22